MEILLSYTLLIIGGFIAGELANKIKLPKLIGNYLN